MSRPSIGGGTGSHPLALAGFVGRLVAVLAIAGGLASAALDVGPSVDVWIGVAYVALAAVILSLLLTAFDWPRGAAAADDELVRASQARSHEFGYWTTLAAFLALLWAVRRDAIPAEAAFLLLSLPLGLAPILYMIVAFLRGRAG